MTNVIHIHLSKKTKDADKPVAPNLASIKSVVQGALSDLEAQDRVFTKEAAAAIKSGSMAESEAVRIQTKHQRIYMALQKAIAAF